MKITAKIFKRKSGKSKGKWVARVEYLDDVSGRTKTMERIRRTKTDAGDERDRLVDAIKKTHGQIRTGERMRFSDLVEVCKERFFKAAVIVEGRKIEGVKSIRTVENSLAVLDQYFGKKLIGQITTEQVKDYRRWRLNIGSRRPELVKAGKFAPVKLSTINRELAAMRRMMRYAFAEGWVTKDIFFGAKIIDTGAETPRHQMLSVADEKRLLEACQGERETTYTRTRFGKKETITATLRVDNPALKAIILLALDSGMRKSEILKLSWSDIDLTTNKIRIRASHTKTERERFAPLTERTKVELYRVREYTPGDQPFPFEDFKRSWETAKRIAGVTDLHFHDLRRSALTRWQSYGLPISLAAKVAGHASERTTSRHYTVADAAVVDRFTEVLNAVHAERVDSASELVN